MNIIAPLPKKPSSYNHKTWLEDDEACQELQQILNSHSNLMMEEYNNNITRTNNPLPNDTSFTPIVLSVQDTSRMIHRPRSFSVGDSKSFTFNSVISLVH